MLVEYLEDNKKLPGILEVKNHKGETVLDQSIKTDKSKIITYLYDTYKKAFADKLEIDDILNQELEQILQVEHKAEETYEVKIAGSSDGIVLIEDGNVIMFV